MLSLARTVGASKDQMIRFRRVRMEKRHAERESRQDQRSEAKQRFHRILNRDFRGRIRKGLPSYVGYEENLLEKTDFFAPFCGFGRGDELGSLLRNPIVIQAIKPLSSARLMRFLPQILILWLLVTVECSAAPRINEFTTSKDNTLAGDDGEFSDWGEIYNPDETSYDLSGCYMRRLTKALE